MTVARKNFPLTGRNVGTDPRLKVGGDLTAPVGLYKYLLTVILLIIMIVILTVLLIKIVLLIIIIIIRRRILTIIEFI